VTYKSKRVDQMTDAEKEQARQDWAEAERRVRGKPSPLNFPRLQRGGGIPNRFQHEDCEGCQRLLARGTIVPTDVEGKWKFLCGECRKAAA
jgi:hypothetical protein